MTNDTLTISRELADIRKLAELACGTSKDSPAYMRFLAAMNPTLLLDLTAAPVVERREPSPIGESTARLMHAYSLGEFEDEGGSGTAESLAVESYDAQQVITGDENDCESYMAGYCAALYEQAQPLLHMVASPPASVAVVLPDVCDNKLVSTHYRNGWNACLDKVKELNQ